jgi:hypothetical protein
MKPRCDRPVSYHSPMFIGDRRTTRSIRALRAPSHASLNPRAETHPSPVAVSGPPRRYKIVAYEVLTLGNGREEIRCTSGRIGHIVRRDDGTWVVDEDECLRVFPTLRRSQRERRRPVNYRVGFFIWVPGLQFELRLTASAFQNISVLFWF